MQKVLEPLEMEKQNEDSQGFLLPSLRRNVLWTLVGNIIYAACQWAMLVVMAKLGSTEMVGHFALALAIVMPVLMFGNLNLRYVQCTDAKGQFAFSDYLGLRLLTSLCVLAVIILIALLGHYPIKILLVILALALTRVFDFVSDILYGLIQQKERMDRIATSLIIKGLLHLAVVGVFIYLTRNLFVALCAMAIVSAFTLFAYDFRSVKLVLTSERKKRSLAPAPVDDLSFSLLPGWRLSTLRKLIWLGLPMGIVLAGNSLTGNIPRYIIAQNLGSEELGIFAAMFYLTVVGNTVTGAMAESAIPRLAKYFANGDYVAFHRLVFKLVGCTVIIGGAGLLVVTIGGRQLLEKMYRPEYAKHASVLVWLMGYSAITSLYSVFGAAITALRRFHLQVPLPCIGATLMFVLSLYLIPRFGVEGAGRAMLISATFSALLAASLLVFCLRKSQSESQAMHLAPVVEIPID
jgi:O-antigen/teichoic acid export membrane protein